MVDKQSSSLKCRSSRFLSQTLHREASMMGCPYCLEDLKYSIRLGHHSRKANLTIVSVTARYAGDGFLLSYRQRSQRSEII